VAGWGPSAEVVEGEFAQGKEEMPEVGRKSGVDSSEGGDNMIFCSLDGAFG
jgi:general stress protein YciG